jgi:hypothetical protein
MKDKRTIQGQWYIFGDGQPPAVGVLNFDPETGLTLDVQRHRAPDLGQAIGGAGFQCPPIVRGMDANGSAVTVFGSFVTKSNSTAALDEYKISVTCATVGAHYNQFNDATFNQIRSTYSVLDAWLIRPSIAMLPQNAGMPAYQQQHPPDVSATLTDGTSVILTMSLHSRTSPSSVTLSQSQYVHFITTNAAPLRTLSDNYVFKFGKLLSFLSRVDVAVDQIVFPQQGAMRGEVEFLCAMPGSTKVKRTLNNPAGLVPYQEIVAQLPALIVRWFDYYEEMEAILNLYFTAISQSDIPVNTRFLLLAQALEAYHSRSDRFVAEIQPKTDFKARLKAILDLVMDGGEKSWLKENLNFANQKKLATRLNELIADQQANVAQFINDPVRFANVIRWTRNYYTHYGAEEEDKIDRGVGRIAQGTDIITFYFQMRALLELLFIRDLQLPASATNRVIQWVNQMQVITA